MGKLQFVTTADGSKTLLHSPTGEHYHSMNGAVRESQHVFLESGLKFFQKHHAVNPVTILEVGFGTGLNFLLSSQFCQDERLGLRYTGIEPNPLSLKILGKSGYDEYVSKKTWDLFISGYEPAMEGEMRFPNNILLEIVLKSVSGYNSAKRFDILYFDAFSAGTQPEMWTRQVLSQASRHLKAGGLFVTYAMNGNLKRNMEALGFSPEKLPGGPGKREMLRATKMSNHPREF